jgi:Mrp family chromosome partitioning ATPase
MRRGRGALDVTVVDMPPETGDTRLTMARQMPLRRKFKALIGMPGRPC